MTRLNVKAPNMHAHAGVSFAGAEVIATNDGTTVRNFNPPAHARDLVALAYLGRKRRLRARFARLLRAG
jgi:hypothetical protein